MSFGNEREFIDHLQLSEAVSDLIEKKELYLKTLVELGKEMEKQSVRNLNSRN